jgi:hypothetical protein
VEFPWRARLRQAFVAITLLISLGKVPINAQPTDSDPSKVVLHNLRDIKAALNSCMKPPPIKEAFAGMQMTVRFSFDAHGGIQGQPRITYFSAGAPEKVRIAYERALLDSLSRCTPLSFSPDLGAAIAGQPYFVRFIEKRVRSGDV